MKRKFLILSLGLFLIFLVAISFALFYYFSKIPVSQASTSENVYGYAWSNNIGWINFNNCEGDPTNPATSCPAPNFGVTIDPVSELLSGYAWSNNIGWLSFNEFDATHPRARLDLDPASPTFNQISGWARFLSQGDNWDGWVKLRDGNYGVSRNGCDLEGFAWGDLVAGWIGFTDVRTTECAVANNPPDITLGSPSLSSTCQLPVAVLFPWRADDPENDNISWFFQADDVPVDWNNPDINESGGPVSDPYLGDRTIIVSSDGPLYFGRTYEWRVRAVDANGADSGWKDGALVSTPANPPPNPSFQCSLDVNPKDWKNVCNELGAVVGEKILFRNPNAGYDPYQWDFDYNPSVGFQPTVTSQSETSYTFDQPRSYTVWHRVTEGGVTCEGGQTINIYERLPIWREIPPT